MPASTLIRDPAELSSGWLGAVLDQEGLELIGSERIGTGQMSQNHRGEADRG